MLRRTLTTAMVAALLLVGLGPSPQGESAGTRLISYYGTFRRDPTTTKFKIWLENNRTHKPAHLRNNAKCDDWYLIYEPYPTSPVAAGAYQPGVDGSLLNRGITAGLASVSGRRVKVGFTQNGTRITCREVFESYSANVWVAGVQAVER